MCYPIQEIIASHKEGDSFDVQDAGGGKYIVSDSHRAFTDEKSYSLL